MAYMTRNEYLDRLHYRMEDASERLANINDAKQAARDKIADVLRDYLTEVERHALRGKPDWHGLKNLNVIDDLLDDLDFSVTNHLREQAEGYDHEEADADEARERRWEGDR